MPMPGLGGWFKLRSGVASGTCGSLICSTQLSMQIRECESFVGLRIGTQGPAICLQNVPSVRFERPTLRKAWAPTCSRTLQLPLWPKTWRCWPPARGSPRSGPCCGRGVSIPRRVHLFKVGLRNGVGYVGFPLHSGEKWSPSAA